LEKAKDPAAVETGPFSDLDQLHIPTLYPYTEDQERIVERLIAVQEEIVPSAQAE
jgi:hypothetical protein